MKPAILAALFLLQGCALRVGLQPVARVNGGTYPPVDGAFRTFCVPCIEFDGWGAGLMFYDGWPVIFYRE